MPEGSRDEEVEHLLRATGAIQSFDDPHVQKCFEFKNGDTIKSVKLYAAGSKTLMPFWLTKENEEFTILLSHHNLPFAGCNKDGSTLNAIPGCDMVVNGYIHKTLPSERVESTIFYCPGDLEPISIDCKDEKPSVWMWIPELGSALAPLFLEHDPNCFNLGRTQVAAATPDQGVENLKESRFASLIASNCENSSGKNISSDIHKDSDLGSVLASMNISTPTATLLRLIETEVGQSL